MILAYAAIQNLRDIFANIIAEVCFAYRHPLPDPSVLTFFLYLRLWARTLRAVHPAPKASLAARVEAQGTGTSLWYVCPLASCKTGRAEATLQSNGASVRKI